MKKIITLLVFQLSFCIASKAQVSPNLILNTDIGTGNFYTWLLSGSVQGAVNGLLQYPLVESTFDGTFYSTNKEMTVKSYNPFGFKAKDLFQDCQFGLKLGYKTASPGFVNGGVYASGHYVLQQFKAGEDKDDLCYHRAQRAVVGLTAMIILGSFENKGRFSVEAGCRYSFGLGYKSSVGGGKDVIGNGLVSHFGLHYDQGWNGLSGITLFADINHFNMWKGLNVNSKLKSWTLGVSVTLTPIQIRNKNQVLQN